MKQAPSLSGLLLVEKPQGMTSHDVVDGVRRLAGQRQVGHSGTLDPMATGLLLLALGHATRLVEYLGELPKQYVADVLLGLETDTYDAAGHVTASHFDHIPNRFHLLNALGGFVGPQQQVPPMFAAIKREGKPLYELARAGIEVEREPRPVTIYGLAVLAFDAPLLRLVVTCGSGTYVRSLAHDLGTKLGCGAHLAGLVRTAIGAYHLPRAHSLDTLREVAAGGSIAPFLLSPAEMVAHLPTLRLTDEQVAEARFGRALPSQEPEPGNPLTSPWELANAIPGGEIPQATFVMSPEGLRAAPEWPRRARALDAGGELVAVLRQVEEGGMWLPEKVFQAADS